MQKTLDVLTWSDTIAIKGFLVGKLLSLPLRPLPHLFRFLCRAEAPASLLVHFCAWCDAIHSHKEQLLRFDLSKQEIHIMKNPSEDLFLGNAIMSILIIWMGA